MLATIFCTAALALLPAWEMRQDTRSLQELRSALEDTDPKGRAVAACTLRGMGDRALPAVPVLVSLLADGSPVDRSACPREWARGNQRGATTPGQIAASALVSIGSPAYDLLARALVGDAWIARRNAAWALGALGDGRAAPLLVDRLRDGEARVREQAAWALGALDRRDAVEPLIAALRDNDAGVRRQAAWALGVVDDPRASAPLIDLLRDSDAEVRAQTAWALGVLESRGAVAPLITALRDADPRVRRQSAWALGVIGGGDALEPLLVALKDQDPGVRRQAARAIGLIGG